MGFPPIHSPITGNAIQTEGGGTWLRIKACSGVMVLQDPTLNIKTEAGLQSTDSVTHQSEWDLFCLSSIGTLPLILWLFSLCGVAESVSRPSPCRSDTLYDISRSSCSL